MPRGRKRKKPKDFDDFWPKYVKEINEIKGILEKKKWIQWLPSFIAVSGILVAFAIGTGWITSEKSPNTVAYEIIQRIHNTTEEGYKVIIHNLGEKFASNVRVKVSFPFQNTTIREIYNFGKELTINETGGVGSYEYTVEYSKIRENEKINLIIIVESDDFEKRGTCTVRPETMVWTDEEGEIELVFLEGFEFIF